ncbi:hypothetical protein D3C80_1993940 [compost metagenome]
MQRMLKLSRSDGSGGMAEGFESPSSPSGIAMDRHEDIRSCGIGLVGAFFQFKEYIRAPREDDLNTLVFIFELVLNRKR